MLRQLAWFIFPDRGLTDSEHFLAERKEGKAGAATRSELGRHIGSFAAREVYQNNSTMPWVCQHLTHLIWPVKPRSLFHGFLGPFFGIALRAGPADALAQRLHQVDNVLAARPLLRHDRLAGALLVDEVDQRRFVLVLELVGLDSPRLLVHDVLG